jgi:hypothetical protein
MRKLFCFESCLSTVLRGGNGSFLMHQTTTIHASDVNPWRAAGARGMG